MSIINNPPFNPIQGSEDRINSHNVVPGNLYCTTDTGKILLDTFNGRIALGGTGSTIFFSRVENLEPSANDTYTIFQSDLNDSKVSLKEDDIIINMTADGGGVFFRVIDFNDSAETPFATCILIGVSGVGGGGSTSGPSDTEDPKVITYEPDEFTPIFEQGTPLNFGFTITKSPISSLNVELTISKTVNFKNVIVDQFYKLVKLNEDSHVQFNNIGANMVPGTIYAMEVKISGLGAKTQTIRVAGIQCVHLFLEKGNFSNTDFFESQIVKIPLKVTGVGVKDLIVQVDGKTIPQDPISTDSYGETVYVNLDCTDLSSGVHTIKAWLTRYGVSSNIVQTDFIYHPHGSPDNVYILILDYPEKCLSYEIPKIKYWVYDTFKDEEAENVVIESLNGVQEQKHFQQKKGQSPYEWNVNGLVENQYNSCAIIYEDTSGNKISKTVQIYCEKSDIFDEVKDAVISLNANGKTNETSLERRKQWKYNNYSASLLNFNWENNGWMTDNQDRSLLRISNGASVEIPITLFTQPNVKNYGCTIELEFKPYNLQSYKLMTKSAITKTNEDEEDKEDVVVTVERAFDPDLAIISYASVRNDGNNKIADGFCCGTQDAFFRMKNGQHATVRYMEDEIITLTLALDQEKRHIYLYVNGVMSGMSSYVDDDDILPSDANKLIFNSNLCDIDLYTIRVYDYALTSEQVVNNYIANKKSFELKKANSFSTGTTVDFNALKKYNEENPNNTTIPYIIFETLEKPDVLPFNKDNPDVTCKITFVNPALDSAFDSEESNITEEYYLSHAPSFEATGVTLNVQGTSSQIYPRKNFKGKFKNAVMKCTHPKFTDEKIIEKSKFSILPNIKERTFTWKADYMDSSSSHNTGLATLAQDLYWNHPLDYYESTSVSPGTKTQAIGENLSKYRTTLYGFPVLAFHKTSDPGSTPQFIGIYNFNLDKGADDTLGMASDKEHPFVKETYINDKGEEKQLDYAHVCECWEFANNKGGRCSFRGNPFDYGYDYDKKTFDNGTSDIGDDLEVRYHWNDKAIEGAWENLTAPSEDGGAQISPEQAFEVLLGGNKDGSNRTGAYKNLEILFKWIQDTFFAFDLKTDQAWIKNLLGLEPDSPNVTEDNLAYQNLIQSRKEKFKNEFSLHLNYEYCMIYYILTEVLLLFDSRGKNMMLASWGPIEEGGDYIWFPIFYDIDTQLGINNSGIPSWEYNVEPSTGFNNNNVIAFSTANSLLWLNFHKYYTEDDLTALKGFYSALRSHKNLDAGYFNAKYALTPTDSSKEYFRTGVLPINLFNTNEYYKYIDPGVSGYVNGMDKETQQPEFRKTTVYYYCLQGTRELHRRQFLRNRFNYYDSKWQAQQYATSDDGGGAADTFWRINKNEKADGEVAGSPVFTLVSKLDQYGEVWPDGVSNPVHKYTPAGQPTSFDLSGLIKSSYQEQIVRIANQNAFFEIGNISLLYPNLLNYDYHSSITKIELGNKNDKYNCTAINMKGVSGIPNHKPMLKICDITNVKNSDLTQLEFTDAYKLEEFKALGSQLEDVIFANSCNLRKIYLPETITKIKLPNLIRLNKLLQQSEVYSRTDNVTTWVDPEPNGLYIDGIDNISEISIQGGSLNQHSYNLLKQLVDNTIAKNDKTLKINLIDLHWTPYTQLEEGAPYNKNKSYWKAESNSTFSAYQYNSNNWDNDVASGLVYEKNNDSTISYAESLELLDLITSHSDLFPNPKLTGNMYINNSSSNKISEIDLSTKYKNAFPNLIIKVAEVQSAYRVRYLQKINGVVMELSKEIIRPIANQRDYTITPPTQTDPPLHYEFKGWSTKEPTGDYEQDKQDIINSLTTATLTDDNPEQIYYAIYDKVSYTICFMDTNGESINDKSYYEVVQQQKYGETIQLPMSDPVHKKESELPITVRYRFYGWTTDLKNSMIVKNASIAKEYIVKYTISDTKIDKDYTFYPVYLEEDVYDSDSDQNYFNFEPIKGGYCISCKQDKILKGKITIPSTYKGEPIISLNNFQNAVNATSIFFREDSQLKTIGQNAFDCEKLSEQRLQGIYLPDSVQTIESKAFYCLYSLKHISRRCLLDPANSEYSTMGPNITTIGDYAFAASTGVGAMSLSISHLSDKLTTIGQSAFYRNELITISELPSGLTSINTNAFAWCKNLKINTIPQSVQTIGSGCFFAAARSNDISQVIIKSQEIDIGGEAFIGYGNAVQLPDGISYASSVTLYVPSSYYEQFATPEDRASEANRIGVYLIDKWEGEI